ncbi:MAG TPA: PAS domain-containing sensor histidine kinase, partial [Rhodospirillaceae bacterium]|nr:PAS domain-containing sensor histidine kinase [Rhodospirillaceae bacterium]
LERFTVVAAHDLREPARSASLHAQVLKKLFADRLDGEGMKHLNFLETAARRMYDIVGGLLSYSEAGSSDRKSHPVSAAAACSLALANLRPQIQQADAEIIVGRLPEVIADKQMLVRLLQNLIDNAIKFRHRERRLRIEIEAAPTADGWEISVADNGLGFEAGRQDIFEIFRRLRQNDETGGIGFGLAICKRIVQHWNGKIWAISTPGAGSRFCFSVPASVEE